MTPGLLLPLLLLGCPPEGHDSDDTDPAADLDEDGYLAEEDCDDSDPLIHPGAIERCNGLDDDCDGALATGEEDADGDGSPDCAHCDAAGLWESTRDETQAHVLLEIFASATGAMSCNYTDATNEMFLRIDNHGGWVECVYTGRTTAVAGQKPDPVNDMNTEHTWLQSEGADLVPAKCDLHHLYPADVDANSARGNNPFGDVVSGVTWSEGGSQLGKNASGQTVFEPRDVHKGNVARSMFYFADRYGHTLSSSEEQLFLSWHALDPVDEAEWERTQAIAETQAYPNPYVACPDLPARIHD